MRSKIELSPLCYAFRSSDGLFAPLCLFLFHLSFFLGGFNTAAAAVVTLNL
uniref:Uncharacterized protein n=1 Tax=Rhizophora mucronata TaxID=61149 RepID=A0A2P2LJL4_RHIMU